MNGDVVANFYDGTEFAGPAKCATQSPEGLLMFMGQEIPGVDVSNFSARIRTTQTPGESGDHQFSLISTGRPASTSMATLSSTLGLRLRRGILRDGKRGGHGTRRLEREGLMRSPCNGVARSLSDPQPDAARMGLSRVVGLDAAEGAVALAKSADVSLLFVGRTGNGQRGHGSSQSRSPGHQNELIRRSPKPIGTRSSCCRAGVRC